MNYNTILINLYHLLIYADGNLNDKEVLSGERMMAIEAIREAEFNTQCEWLRSNIQPVLLTACLENLRKLDRNQQIRIIAWLCVVANADGFMDRTEWQLIYKIYHKELRLPLEEIFATQKELSKLTLEKSQRIARLDSQTGHSPFQQPVF